MNREFKEYKGYIMLFGLFRIRRDFSFWQQCTGSPYAFNDGFWKTLEPLLRKVCTIKWLEMEENDSEIAYKVA
jgi:hypothetical protein